MSSPFSNSIHLHPIIYFLRLQAAAQTHWHHPTLKAENYFCFPHLCCIVSFWEIAVNAKETKKVGGKCLFILMLWFFFHVLPVQQNILSQTKTDLGFLVFPLHLFTNWVDTFSSWVRYWSSKYVNLIIPFYHAPFYWLNMICQYYYILFITDIPIYSHFFLLWVKNYQLHRFIASQTQVIVLLLIHMDVAMEDD